MRTHEILLKKLELFNQRAIQEQEDLFQGNVNLEFLRTLHFELFKEDADPSLEDFSAMIQG